MEEEKYLKKIEEMEQFAKENYVPIIKKDSSKYIKNVLVQIFNRKIKEKLNKKQFEESVIDIDFNILELGTAIAYSSIIFTKEILNLKDKFGRENELKLNLNIKYLTCEKDSERYNLAIENINYFSKENGFNNLNFKNIIYPYNLDAEKFIENIKKGKIKVETNKNELYESLSKFDLIFIDANKSAYLKYFLETKELIQESGIILFDNILFNGWVFGNYHEKKHRTIVNNLRNFINYLDNNNIEYKILYEADGILQINGEILQFK